MPAELDLREGDGLTPLIGEPLTGPVYLRASNDILPEMVATLKGGGVEVEVVGRIDAPHGGLRGRFEVLPDAPVTKFVLKLKGGNRALSSSPSNICAQEQFAAARMVGQNNVGVRFTPVLTPECKKRKRGGK